jgi:hypothetical protein
MSMVFTADNRRTKLPPLDACSIGFADFAIDTALRVGVI